MDSRCRAIVLGLFVVILAAVPVAAQTSMGTVEGTVTDSIVWDDCSIARAVTLERCIVGHRVRLAEGHYRDAMIVRDDSRIPAEYERVGGLVVRPN